MCDHYFKQYFIFILFLFNYLIINAQQTGGYKINKIVYEKLQLKTKTTCLVLMVEQADVSAAKKMQSKEARGHYVFNKLQETAQRTQVNVIQIAKQANAHFIPFYVANAIMIEADLAVLEAIAELPEVKAILPNLPIRSDFPVEMQADIPTKNIEDIEWGIRKIEADKLWELGVNGAGVVVGGQDTGYEWDHPAIVHQYKGNRAGIVDHNYAWHDAIHEKHPENADTLNPCGFNSIVPCDDHSHGTHTVGTMVGYDGADNYIGVAPGAKWMGCRNMERGWGLPSTYIECFEWFLAPTDLSGNHPNPEKAPHVINNSWSCPDVEGCNPSNFEVMRLAVYNLRMAGIVVVVSAGNSGPDCNTIDTPSAIFSESFSVGASTPADTIVRFSSRGVVNVDGSGRMKPNISAPGTSVRSCVLDSAYASYSGTSMAGPHVVGAVALLISAAPELAGRVELIEEILEQTAIPLYSEQECGGISGTIHPNNTAGWGRIDLLKALSVVRPDLVNGLQKGSYDIRIFPNPNDGHFMVVTPEYMGPTIIKAYNAVGQEVLYKKVNFTRVQQIDLGELPNGMYLISFMPESNPKGIFTAKIVKRSNP